MGETVLRKLTEKEWQRIQLKCRRVGDCFIWTGYTDMDGYARVKRDGHLIVLSRLVFNYFHGPIPEGLTIDHVHARGCHSRACLEPAHLEAVTNRENVLRGNGPPAQNARKTHCKKGHPFAGHNLIIWKNGWRECRICRNARWMQGYWKRKS